MSPLQLKDLIPALYQEGRYQGSPITLGVGGFGRVELVQPNINDIMELHELPQFIHGQHQTFSRCYRQLLLVLKVTTLQHGKYYAIKKVSKKLIVEKRQTEHILFEKKLLLDVQSDFIVRSGHLMTIVHLNVVSS